MNDKITVPKKSVTSEVVHKPISGPIVRNKGVLKTKNNAEGTLE